MEGGLALSSFSCLICAWARVGYHAAGNRASWQGPLQTSVVSVESALLPATSVLVAKLTFAYKNEGTDLFWSQEEGQLVSSAAVSFVSLRLLPHFHSPCRTVHCNVCSELFKCVELFRGFLREKTVVSKDWRIYRNSILRDFPQTTSHLRTEKGNLRFCSGFPKKEKMNGWSPQETAERLLRRLWGWIVCLWN